MAAMVARGNRRFEDARLLEYGAIAHRQVAPRGCGRAARFGYRMQNFNESNAGAQRCDPLPRGTRARVVAAGAAVLLLCACGGPRQISESGYGAYEVSLAAWQEEGLAVAWYDTRDGNAEAYVRLLDADGQPIGGDRRLTSTSDQSYEADIAAFAGGVAVAWYEKTAEGSLHARLGAWSRDLEPLWSLPLGAAQGSSRNPLVRAGANGLFAAWIERTGSGRETVRAAWFGFDGIPRGEPVTLGRASDTTWNLNAALDPRDTPYVVYDAVNATDAEEVFLAALTAAGPKLLRLTADDGFPSKYPDMAIAGSQFAITWHDERDANQEIYLVQGFVAVDLRADAFEHPRRITNTPGHSIGAYVAWNRARLGLAWSDDTEGEHEIYYLSFAENGAPVGAVQRLTTNPTSSLVPAIKAWRDGFALAWCEVTLAGVAEHDETTRSEVMFALTDD
jgi:hypothetical protein